MENGTISQKERIEKELEDMGFWGDIGEYLGYLYHRWQDEKEFEDFNDYKGAIKKKMPKGFEFINLTKRPFELTAKYKNLHIFIKATASAYYTAIEEI